MSKKTYTVLSPVDHDQERFEIGSSISLEDTDAAALLTAKAIELATAVQPTAPAGAPTDDAERISAIVSAIGNLDPADATLFTGAGVPKTESLTAITGWPVAGKDRDAAWSQVKSAE